jgi:hypothetical protein
LGADIADRAEFDARNRFCLAARYSENGVASLDEDAAERTADEPGCTGHQNARQTSPSAAEPATRFRERSPSKCIKEVATPRQGRKTAPRP